MIPLIRSTIRALPVANTEELSFLKYSTPNSGRTLQDKVIFLAFGPDAASPSLCIKTVRNYGARNTIRRSFENLKSLHAATAGKPSERLFARAVHLHDDGENIFSVETACEGERVRLTEESLEKVVRAYVEFQSEVAAPPLRGMEELLPAVLGISGLREEDRKELEMFFDSLPSSSLKLPHVLQLGDLTEDNLLLSPERLSIVDYDRVGEVDLPGFDLLGLFTRFDSARAKELCEQYLPEYFVQIGAEGRGPLSRVLFLYYIAERTVRKPYHLKDATAGDIIADFSRLFL